MTLYAAVASARDRLRQAGIESAEWDAITLAARVLGVETGDVQRSMVLRDRVADGFSERFEELVELRADRVPLQHLTGRAGFRRLMLEVGPGVFVPRPETEVVAGLAIDAVRVLVDGGTSTPVLVDLCTGSGAIALTVKDEVPTARVHAIELSELAYGWAVANRDRLGLDVDLRLGDATDAFADLAEEVDVVVSNPPYIPTGMVPVDPEVRDHDPALALYGGSDDGLAIPLAVAGRAAHLLRPGGTLVMEHADVQADTLRAGFEATGHWWGITGHRDLSGRPRAIVARRV